jgi:hypothetical protein
MDEVLVTAAKGGWKATSRRVYSSGCRWFVVGIWLGRFAKAQQTSQARCGRAPATAFSGQATLQPRHSTRDRASADLQQCSSTRQRGNEARP